jgi:hypothetical protein
LTRSASCGIVVLALERMFFEGLEEWKIGRLEG